MLLSERFRSLQVWGEGKGTLEDEVEKIKQRKLTVTVKSNRTNIVQDIATERQHMLCALRRAVASCTYCTKTEIEECRAENTCELSLAEKGDVNLQTQHTKENSDRIQESGKPDQQDSLKDDISVKVPPVSVPAKKTDSDKLQEGGKADQQDSLKDGTNETVPPVFMSTKKTDSDKLQEKGSPTNQDPLTESIRGTVPPVSVPADKTDSDKLQENRYPTKQDPLKESTRATVPSVSLSTNTDDFVIGNHGSPPQHETLDAGDKDACGIGHQMKVLAGEKGQMGTQFERNKQATTDSVGITTKDSTSLSKEQNIKALVGETVKSSTTPKKNKSVVCKNNEKLQAFETERNASNGDLLGGLLAGMNTMAQKNSMNDFSEMNKTIKKCSPQKKQREGGIHNKCTVQETPVLKVDDHIDSKTENISAGDGFHVSFPPSSQAQTFAPYTMGSPRFPPPMLQPVMQPLPFSAPFVPPVQSVMFYPGSNMHVPPLMPSSAASFVPVPVSYAPPILAQNMVMPPTSLYNMYVSTTGVNMYSTSAAISMQNANMSPLAQTAGQNFGFVSHTTMAFANQPCAEFTKDTTTSAASASEGSSDMVQGEQYLASSGNDPEELKSEKASVSIEEDTVSKKSPQFAVGGSENLSREQNSKASREQVMPDCKKEQEQTTVAEDGTSGLNVTTENGEATVVPDFAVVAKEKTKPNHKSKCADTEPPTKPDKKHKGAGSRPTKPETVGKFHGRTLLIGKEVPPRYIPLEPLHRSKPFTSRGTPQVIPLDPRKDPSLKKPNTRLKHAGKQNMAVCGAGSPTVSQTGSLNLISIEQQDSKEIVEKHYEEHKEIRKVSPCDAGDQTMHDTGSMNLISTEEKDSKKSVEKSDKEHEKEEVSVSQTTAERGALNSLLSLFPKQYSSAVPDTERTSKNSSATSSATKEAPLHHVFIPQKDGSKAKTFEKSLESDQHPVPVSAGKTLPPVEVKGNATELDGLYDKVVHEDMDLDSGSSTPCKDFQDISKDATCEKVANKKPVLLSQVQDSPRQNKPNVSNRNENRVVVVKSCSRESLQSGLKGKFDTNEPPASYRSKSPEETELERFKKVRRIVEIVNREEKSKALDDKVNLEKSKSCRSSKEKTYDFESSRKNTSLRDRGGHQQRKANLVWSRHSESPANSPGLTNKNSKASRDQSSARFTLSPDRRSDTEKRSNQRKRRWTECLRDESCSPVRQKHTSGFERPVSQNVATRKRSCSTNDSSSGRRHKEHVSKRLGKQHYASPQDSDLRQRLSMPSESDLRYRLNRQYSSSESERSSRESTPRSSSRSSYTESRRSRSRSSSYSGSVSSREASNCHRDEDYYTAELDYGTGYFDARDLLKRKKHY